MRSPDYDEREPRSYVVEVNTYGDRPESFASNGLRFKTWDEANDWGQDLFSRWTAVREFRVSESMDEPNR